MVELKSGSSLPQKMLQEYCGELLELSGTSESEYSLLRESSPVWFGRQFGEAGTDGGNNIASLDFLGSNILAVSDTSAVIARNRCCALVVAYLENNPTLFDRLKRCRYTIESGMASQSR